VSDTWYRAPEVIPPYEDFEGSLWTVDGVCLNPVHTCEPPGWYDELAWLGLQAEIAMGLRSALGRAFLAVWNHRTYP
jgi:hypothetical protein